MDVSYGKISLNIKREIEWSAKSKSQIAKELGILNEKLFDQFADYLLKYQTNRMIVKYIVMIMAYLCGTHAFVSVLQSTPLFKVLFTTEEEQQHDNNQTYRSHTVFHHEIGYFID